MYTVQARSVGRDVEREILTLTEGSVIGTMAWVFLGDSCIMTQDNEHKNIYYSICHYCKILEQFKCPKTREWI